MHTYIHTYIHMLQGAFVYPEATEEFPENYVDNRDFLVVGGDPSLVCYDYYACVCVCVIG